MCCKFLCWLSSLLSAIGAINWGLVVFFKFNLVDWLDKLAGGVGLDKIVYAIVALAGLYTLLSITTFHLFVSK
jgi:uncharacterized protein